MPLEINNVVDVQLQITPTSPVRRDLNLGLIMGTTDVITAETRVAIYSGLDEMITAGFETTDPEYLAAALYFSRSPRPQRVAIGRQGVAPETPVQAVTAARLKNSDWYAVTYVTALSDAEITAIAAYVEACSPDTTFFYTTSSAGVLTNEAGNIFATLKAAGYRRTHGMYSAGESPIAAASVMAYAMAVNFALANSAYTLSLKSLPGVTPDSLTSTNISNIKTNNGNYYVQLGGTYNVLQNGVQADGSFFDEVHGLDWLKLQIQRNVMDLLTSVAKVPQLDIGTTSIINAIATALEGGVRNLLIAPGVWTGPAIFTLETGTPLESGYAIMAEAVADQSAADRQARKAPPIYVAVILAGAIHTSVISVYVNR
jgi:hypothetical protein